MIKIQPKPSAASPAPGAPAYVATAFTVDYQMRGGVMLQAQPAFFDEQGKRLPNGAIPLVLAPGQTPEAAQTTESSMIALACSESPNTVIDVAASAVVVATRSITLA